MPLSQNLNAYADIERVLPHLLELGCPFRLVFERKQDAVAWRQRFYRYRDLKRKQALDAVGDVPGYTPSTGMDQYVIAIELGDTTSQWVVEIREIVQPRMIGPDGKEIML